MAIVHEWLTTLGGSELVLKEMPAVYPQADLFALVDVMAPGDREALALALTGRKVRTTWMQLFSTSRIHRNRAFLTTSMQHGWCEATAWRPAYRLAEPRRHVRAELAVRDALVGSFWHAAEIME